MACSDKNAKLGSAKFLDFKIVYQIIKNMIREYGWYSGNTDYDAVKYPNLIEVVGTASGAVFTPTVAPAWTIDDKIDQWVAVYKDGDKDIYTLQQIVSNTADTFTVATAFDATVDTYVFLDSEYKQYEEATGVTDDSSFSDVDTGSADSKNFETSENGSLSNPIGATAIYRYRPVQKYLDDNKKNGCFVASVRWGNRILEGDVYYTGTARLKSSKTDGDWNDKQTQTVDLMLKTAATEHIVTAAEEATVLIAYREYAAAKQ